MAHFEVDPDSLTAAGEVANRQRSHLSSASDYVGGVLSRFDAFSGVLNIFEGNYRETVQTAEKGLSDSRTVADKVKTSFDGCRDDYLESDRASHKVFQKLFGDEMALPPYVAPGSGNTTPGGPTSAPPGAPGAKDEDDPFGLPGLPPWADKPLGRIASGPHEELPPWLDPQQAGKDAVLDSIRDARTREAYMDARAQGMTPEEALSQARRNPDSIADTQNYDRIEDRAGDAYDSAYDDAIADGKSPEDARSAANDAASEQRGADSLDHRNRNDILGAAGTYKGAYDEVSSTIDNVNDLVEGTQQLDETIDDTNEYDDYENQPDDESAQEWAR